MKENDLGKLTSEELISNISPSSPVVKELVRRGVFKNKNHVGNLGEYYAVKFYNKTDNKIYIKTKDLPNLTIASQNTKNVNALGINGKKYNIKCITSSTGTTGSFWKPKSIDKNEKIFDYLVIVTLDSSWQVDRILELTWEDFMKNKKFNSRMENYAVSVTNKLINKFTIIYKKSKAQIV